MFGGFYVVNLSEAATDRICYPPGADNSTEEEAHGVADMESAGACRETEISQLRRFRAVVDNLIDCRCKFNVHTDRTIIELVPDVRQPKRRHSRKY